jgi:hypothetical protein
MCNIDANFIVLVHGCNTIREIIHLLRRLVFIRYFEEGGDDRIATELLAFSMVLLHRRARQAPKIEFSFTSNAHFALKIGQ